MSLPNADDPSDKFDKFIRNFDQKLKTDTSTLTTIGRKNEDGTDLKEAPQSPKNETSKMSSPLLSTPTKPKRNSISLDSQPLGGSDDETSFNSAMFKRGVTDESVRRINLLSKRVDSSPIHTVHTPDSIGGKLTRSSTMSSVRLGGSKRGLNLNLSINKQRASPSISKLRSPETPAPSNNTIPPIIPTSTPTQDHSSVDKFDKSRRRTNSSLSSHSSVVQDLKNNDFNDSLRELALKEMKIIELKDQLKLIQQKIDKEENELKALKLKIGSNFNSPIQNQTNQTNNNSLQHKSPEKDTPLISNNDKEEKAKKRQSVWSKPINFLNQFDQILQNEIERLNREAFPSQNIRQHPAETLNENDELNTEPSNSKDVLNTVSNSLWSFVSDVKHGLLGDDYTDDDNDDDQSSQKSQIDDESTLQSNIPSKDKDNIINDKKYDNDEQEMISIIERKRSV